MILRVPDEIADRLNALFEEEGEESEHMIDITPCIVRNPKSGDVTQFKFKFENFESNASLVDLPCIIESHKSVDSINLFKSNDISQMMYVHPNKEKFLEDIPNHQKIAKKVVSQSDDYTKVTYLARDGITVPAKSINTRFFRKDFEVDKGMIEQIEDEMSLILDEIKKNKKDGEGSQNSDSDRDSHPSASEDH